MPDETSASTMSPGNMTNGISPGIQTAVGSPSSLAINKRLPRGEDLPDYAVEYFNQLVAQYLTLPSVAETARNANAKAVAEGLIGEQEQEKAERERHEFRWPWKRKKRYLNWGDVSGMEMALLQLLPEAHLQRYAWNLRARYHEVAGQAWYDFYRQSKPPNEPAPPEEAGDAAISITGIPPGASGLFLLTPATPEPPTGAVEQDSPSAARLRADLSVLLSDLQRLRSTIKAREEKHSRISLIGALLAATSLTLALGCYSAPSFYEGWTAKRPALSAPLSAPLSASPTASAHKVVPGASPAGVASTKLKPMAGAPSPTSPLPDPTSPPLKILQMAALVILCGVLGGLISMLRRLQALPPGSTPLFDTIALNAGQLGIGLAPIYGGIFAMVLYLVFLSGILDTVIAGTAGNAVFPRFSDAIPKTTPDYAKLLVWAFIAGFAEQLVPDVLNRLTARNAASLARAAGAPGAAPPSRPE